jgi:hypothetical protein
MRRLKKSGPTGKHPGHTARPEVSSALITRITCIMFRRSTENRFFIGARI